MLLIVTLYTDIVFM